MMKVWVGRITPPITRSETFVAEGRILLNSSKLYSVAIYHSSLDTSRTFNSGVNILMTCSSYSTGELIAGVIPEPYYYTGVKTIRPLKWVVSGQYFGVEFPASFEDEGEGLYTIVVWAENTLHAKHPLDEDRYGDHLPVLKYTFSMGSR